MTKGKIVKDLYRWNDEMSPGPWGSVCRRRRMFVLGVKVVIPRVRRARKLAEYRGALTAVTLDLGVVSVVVGYTWEFPHAGKMLPVSGQANV